MREINWDRPFSVTASALKPSYFSWNTYSAGIDTSSDCSYCCDQIASGLHMHSFACARGLIDSSDDLQIAAAKLSGHLSVTGR